MSASAPLLTDTEADELLNSMEEEEITLLAAGGMVDQVEADIFIDTMLVDKITVKQEAIEADKEVENEDSATQDGIKFSLDNFIQEDTPNFSLRSNDSSVVELEPMRKPPIETINISSGSSTRYSPPPRYSTPVTWTGSVSEDYVLCAAEREYQRQQSRMAYELSSSSEEDEDEELIRLREENLMLELTNRFLTTIHQRIRRDVRKRAKRRRKASEGCKPPGLAYATHQQPPPPGNQRGTPVPRGVLQPGFITDISNVSNDLSNVSLGDPTTYSLKTSKIVFNPRSEQGEIGLSIVVNVMDEEAAKEDVLLAEDNTVTPDNTDGAGAHAKQMNRDPRVRGILRNAPQVPLAVNPEPHPQAEDLLIELPTLCDTGVVTFPKSLQLMANGTSCACKGVKCRGRTMTYAAIAP